MAVQPSGVERVVWPRPHLYVVGGYSGALMTVLGAVSDTTMEWSWGMTSDGRELPELHTAAPGEVTQSLAHCGGMSSAEQETRKGDKRKLQSEPSLVYIVRNTHVNTPNTHAYHTHTKKLVHFLWQTHNSLAWVRDKEKAYFDSWFWSKVKGHLDMAFLLPECSGSIG